MGRKRTPTALRLIMGNPSGRPIPKNEPKPSMKMPPIPDDLCDDARQEWERVAPALNLMGVLTEIDGSALAAYCTAYALWQQSWRAINSMRKEGSLGSGLMIKTTNGNLIQNPLVGTANKAAGDMVRFAGELGMTPVARTRIKAGPGEKTEVDKFFD